jgi:hypothetical protein
MVSRDDGYRKDSPTGCPEPARWTGVTMIGKRRYRLDSCGGHVDGLENVRPIRQLTQIQLLGGKADRSKGNTERQG